MDFSVLGSIIDCVPLRKLVYRPKNRRPDKILKNPLINQLDGALVYRDKWYSCSKILDSLMAWLGEKKKDRIQLNSS